MFSVLERRNIAGYVTECKGENSRKEQADVVWWFSRLVVSVVADNKITKQQISKQPNLCIQDFTTHFVIDCIV